MSDNNAVFQAFARAFAGAPDRVARAPCRVNLIGEHTDYNDGFVLPMAIDYDVRIAARARPDRLVRLYSVDFADADVFHLDDIRHGGPSQIAENRERTWSWYVRGVADALQREGYLLRGMDAAIAGDVPVGAGLSSSAALELAAITAFDPPPSPLRGGIRGRSASHALDPSPIRPDRGCSGGSAPHAPVPSPIPPVGGDGGGSAPPILTPVQAALLAQRAENDFVGVKCGIMDQLIAALGQAEHALLIDCRALRVTPVPLPPGASVVVADSGVRRGLVDSAYNERREQCEYGARLLGVPALRDATLDMLAARAHDLPETVARRCQHVVAENARVLDAVAALQAGDLPAFGALMNQSHASLRDLFEVSTPEMDILVEIQQRVPGCFGARLTGAGFGGCTVALVRADAVPDLLNAINVDYPARVGRAPHTYVCRASAGASMERLPS